MNRLHIWVIAFAAACSGGDSSGPLGKAKQPPVESIILEVPSPVQVGYRARVSVTLVDASRNILAPRPVTFSSSDQRVATIEANGSFIGVAEGVTTIIARADDKIAQAELKVETAPCIPVPWWDEEC